MPETRDHAPAPRLNDRSRGIIVRHLAETRPAVIYLFGSHGTGRQRPDSDMDLAVLPGVDLDPFRLFTLAGDLSSELGREVDLVDLSKASTVFRKEVLRTGDRLAVEDVDAMRTFEMYTLSDYARLNEERHEILNR